ncbi:MAG: hypothetical protein JWM10_3759 [Myxococcaceae bacterium]|nr:hypothetical protein [Myxococcaceae bacterium]
MPIELKMLAWTVALGIVQIVLGASLATAQRGVAFNVSPRDAVVPPLTGVAGRVDRALRNLLETFPFFAAAALAVVFTQRTNGNTALGAQLYFGARVIYLGLYAAGVPYARTLVWTASMVGLFLVLLPLFS